MRKKNIVEEEQTPISNILTQNQAEPIPIEEMPLNTIRDYRMYNEEARKMNKKLRVCRYPIKQCPIDLHPKQRIVFRRNDQPSNPLPVFVSNEWIHFDEKLIPGKEYDLPEVIVDYLAKKGNPVWKRIKVADGEESVISHKEPRFSLTTVFSGY